MNNEIHGQELIKVSKVYESLRYNEYSLENGIGEIVDNSIEAKPTKISIFIDKEKGRIDNKKKELEYIKSIAVVDDGCGMNRLVLSKCLVLGESIRENNKTRSGIGRFGVGLTLGSISLARKVEVYSRTSKTDEFLYTYIDLDEIKSEEKKDIDPPIIKKPDDKYYDLLNDSSGTIVILSNCDRLVKNFSGKVTEANEVVKNLTTYLGRTYRKFIQAGIEIMLDDKKVFLHDPLYVMGPTFFDTKDHIEPKATIISTESIELEIPNSNGKKAEVTVTMTLLPEEWRKRKGAGGTVDAKKRKIDQNEGISILRANREVLYAHVPYIIGKKGQAKALDIDRFWGCEVSFPPELDDYFQVRYIKRGAQPVDSLRVKLNEIISPTVQTLRNRIRDTFKETEYNEIKENKEYIKAEEVMEKVSSVLPGSKRGIDISPEYEQMVIEQIVNEVIVGGETEKEKEEERAEKKEKIRKKPYSIELVKYPMTILFEPEFLMDKIIFKININHPFYEKVIKPLCGDLEVDETEDKKISTQKSEIKDAIMFLLLSYCKAESMFNGQDELFVNLRSQWGIFLSTIINQYYQ